MAANNNDWKHLFLWLGVAIVGTMIVIGWFWALRYNFQKIAITATGENKTTEQLEQEVQEMFSGLETVLQKNEELMQNLAEEKRAVVSEAAAGVQKEEATAAEIKK